MRPALRDVAFDGEGARANEIDLRFADRVIVRGRGVSRVSKRDHILVGLDIGTTKICAIVAEVPEEGPLNIIGVGSCPSRGLRKGVVVNIESTVESIKKAVEEAELMAAVQINSVYTGIAGSHISGENLKGVVGPQETGSHARRHQPCSGKCANPRRDSSRASHPARVTARIHGRRSGRRAGAAGHVR
jgi:hypothetical protein